MNYGYKDLLNAIFSFDYDTIVDYECHENKIIIVTFSDGDVQRAVCNPEDVFSEERGIEVCVMKHELGNSGIYNNLVKNAIEQCNKIKEGKNGKN